MNFQQQLGNLQQQVNMEMFESLLAMQDPQAQTSQHQGHSTPGANPQALLEHQLRLNQLQQLQQLQNQIFQQQLELLSGGQNSFSSSLPPVLDRQRDGSQYGLPTPLPSGELRATQNTDYVSPMLLHSGSNNPMGAMVQNQNMLPNFIPQIPHMLPSAPHSAPAHIAFQPPAFHLPSPGELDMSELPPISSPILGSYNTTLNTLPGASSSQSMGRIRGSTTAGTKRPNASSSGDESSAASRPARKRPSPADRNSGASSSKRATARATRSATNTPLFPATAPSSAQPSPAHRGVPGFGDIPKDTPSPVDPPMPPPAHPPPDAPLSAISGPSTSPTPPLPTSPSSTISEPQHTPIQPVTPAQMFKLGRLAVENSLPSQSGARDGGAALKPKEGKPATRSSTGAASSKAKAADKASGAPLISPALKPIRPAGGGVVTPVTASPSTPFMPPQMRKSSHKAAEQKRRDSLKTSFDDLRILLPPIPLPSEEGFPDEPILPGAMPPRGPPKGNVEGPNRGVSKLQLLRCGNEYIKVLKGRVDRRDEEIARLRLEVQRLRVVAGDEAAAPPDGQEVVDLERDVDACEYSGGVFGRAVAGLMRSSSVAEGDIDEED
nr:transcription factor bHLH4 [Ganoderma lucidum]